MKVGFVTNARAPYRIIQLNKIIELSDIDFNVYYTNKDFNGRKWENGAVGRLKEYPLKGISLFKKRINTFDVNINFGLLKIIKNNDVILLGGYEQPTYLLVSMLCRIFRKKYIFLFDGISPQMIGKKENKMVHLIKRFVIDGSKAIFGNGTVSKLYFSKNFNYNPNKIFNQFLTVDTKLIESLSEYKKQYRKELREKYNISEDSKVILYSGRLLDWKNINVILEAVNIKNNNYVILIVGDGPERENIEMLAKKYNLNVIITGFIREQAEVFKHYFAGDVFVFPTSHEAWGLVVNEAMSAGLPIIASNEAGASLDLVHDGENGYIFKYDDPKALSEKISEVFSSDESYNSFSKESKNIIKNWTFENSAMSFQKLMKTICN